MKFGRALCLLLVLVFSVCFAEVAEEEIPYSPIKDVAGIRINDYTDTVTRGEVRFVCQQRSTAANYGWGKYANNRSKTYGPANNCTTAVQSMAFSYIGIDATPEKIVAQITSFITNYGFEDADMAYRTGYSADLESLDRFLNRFLSDTDASISPVIIHYQNGRTKSSLHQHSVLVIGKDAEGNYIALDPSRGWNDCVKTFTLVKKKNGRTYLSGDVARGNENVYLDAVEQYYLFGTELN